MKMIAWLLLQIYLDQIFDGLYIRNVLLNACSLETKTHVIYANWIRVDLLPQSAIPAMCPFSVISLSIWWLFSFKIAYFWRIESAHPLWVSPMIRHLLNSCLLHGSCNACDRHEGWGLPEGCPMQLNSNIRLHVLLGNAWKSHELYWLTLGIVDQVGDPIRSIIGIGMRLQNF